MLPHQQVPRLGQGMHCPYRLVMPQVWIWAYKVGSSYNISSTGTENATSVPGSQWLISWAVEHGLLGLIASDYRRKLAYDQKSFSYSTFDGSDINITSPAAGDVYAGDDLIVSYSYASSDGGYSSPRWAYSSSSYGWQSAPESYSTSVGSSQWLNYLFNGYDSTRTLYVRLLDHASGAVLASDQRTFMAATSMLPHQQVGQGMHCPYRLVMPQVWDHIRWAYKVGSSYNISSTGTEVNATSVPGSQWLDLLMGSRARFTWPYCIRLQEKSWLMIKSHSVLLTEATSISPVLLPAMCMRGMI